MLLQYLPSHNSTELKTNLKINKIIDRYFHNRTQFNENLGTVLENNRQTPTFNHWLVKT